MPLRAKVPMFGDTACTLKTAGVSHERREIRLTFALDSAGFDLDVFADLDAARELRDRLEKGIRALEVQR